MWRVFCPIEIEKKKNKKKKNYRRKHTKLIHSLFSTTSLELETEKIFKVLLRLLNSKNAIHWGPEVIKLKEFRSRETGGALEQSVLGGMGGMAYFLLL